MTTVEINGIAFGIEDIEKDCWKRLVNGSLKFKDPFHNPTVANSNDFGVNIRTVVLRKADEIKKELAFYTDIRSGKWNELNLNNTISWLFYSSEARMQIRLSGSASLHQKDAIADEGWEKSTLSSRKIYLGEMGPSSVSEIPISGLTEKFETSDPTPEESLRGRKNFGIVITKVKWMEWLWLSSKGHRRASFQYNNTNEFMAKWLVP
jgi:pyridoxamine 5'-phosphate oxidase